MKNKLMQRHQDSLKSNEKQVDMATDRYAQHAHV
jgi:hypothetical protein